MSTPKITEPMVDTPVYAADGEQFGYVKEVQGGYFKIDVAMAKDYWLSTTYIADCTMDKVTLTLPKGEIDQHRLSAPGAEIPHNDDHVLSDADALQQRERMERELEEQRAKLRTGQL